VKLISFAWTSKALVEGKKTVTRRNWKRCRIKVGDLVQAWDRLPTRGGKKIAIIKILDIKYEPLNCFPESDLEKEGWFAKTVEEFIQSYLQAYPDMSGHDYVWRIEFELKEICQ